MGGRASYLKFFINYIIYFKYILNIWMGQVGLSLSGLEFYDPNLTRPAIKKNFVTQSNPPSPKNQPNPVGWVVSGRCWWVGGLTAHP